MDYVRCEMSVEIYKKISPQLREDIEILQVEPKDYDYSNNEIWVERKAESNRAYRELKKLEYDIRMGKYEKD